MVRFTATTAIVLAIAVSLVSAQPASTSPEKLGAYDYGFLNRRVQKRQTSVGGTIVVTGIQNSNPAMEPPSRLEIRQVREDKYSWNLLLLAFSMMQFADQDDLLSYYQIAGIHGLPFKSWNGVEAKSGQTSNSGYCTHASVLFPTWHRPYLALIEKILYDNVQEIASWYPDGTEGDRYRAAARNWRMPYWDWALDPPNGESIFLSEFQTSGIRVTGPAGTQLIANPLYSYRFNPLDTSAFHYVGFQSWRSTMRYPTSDAADATSQNNLAAQELDAQTSSLQQRVFTLLSRNEGYNAFSSKVYNATSGRPHESVEAIHDVIHVATGGGGHLYYIPFSAFDPVFFLHHVNVDRLTAVWQTMHPDSWISDYAAGENSYTTEMGEIVNGDSPLTPFYADANGTFWTSNMVRDTRTFGYVYEETASLPMNGSVSMSRKDLVSTIVTKYGQTGIGGILSGQTVAKRDQDDDEEDDKDDEEVDDSNHQRLYKNQTMYKQPQRAGKPKFRVQEGQTVNYMPDLSRHSTIPDPPISTIVDGTSYLEWLLDVNVPNRALDSTFAIHFFLGPPPEKSSQWGSAKNLVGSVSVFAMLGMGNPNSAMVGTVPLTGALIKMISLGYILGLEQPSVLPFLKKNLHVRVAKDGSEAVEPSSVPGLTVKIAVANVSVDTTGEELPSWGAIKDLFTIPPADMDY